MNTTSIFINLFALLLLIFAFLKDKEKSKKALLISLKSFIRIIPNMLVIVILIGLMLGLIPKSEISKIVGEQSGFKGIIITAITGSILQIPSLISFPLAASLLQQGATITIVAVFITTLTMIGVVMLPLEIRELGKKMALLRNILSFLIAILIGIIMGVLL